jgi:hypothetical protein
MFGFKLGLLNLAGLDAACANELTAHIALTVRNAN